MSDVICLIVSGVLGAFILACCIVGCISGIRSGRPPL